MPMSRSCVAAICLAALVGVASAGAASATPVNLVQNGDFSSMSTPSGHLAVTPGTPTQLNYAPFIYPNYGEFVTGWKTTGSVWSQNVIWVPSATAASTVNASDIDTTFFGFPVRPLLPSSVTAPPDGGAFLAIQSNLVNSGIQQTVTGLTPGQTYTVSFYWAATMDNIDTAVESSSLTVFMDHASYATSTQTVSSNNGFWGTHSTPTFNGWLAESFDFVADTGSSVLKFLASGTPQGLPPYALLSGVSITQRAVPEPQNMLGLFAGGLALVGWVAFLRRRKQRV